MQTTTLLRNMLMAGKTVVAPGVYDGMEREALVATTEFLERGKRYAP